MKGSTVQVNLMQEKEKTELEINIVTESIYLSLQITDEVQNSTFQWISAELKSFQVAFWYFKLNMRSDKT